MERPFAKGPLAVRWLGLDVPEIRAGALTTAVVALENVGSAEWRSTDTSGILVAYHWLDDRGNPIVWDGDRSPLQAPVPPGGQGRAEVVIRGAIPPGRYTLGIDLVDEGRAWFAELGNEPLTAACDVLDRIPRALAVRGGDAAALAAQEEPLATEDDAAAVAYLGHGVAPEPDWSRRVLDAHQEGYALVGGSVAAEAGLFRRAPRELEPYAPGPGRIPGFAHPLACPSVVVGVEPEWMPPVAGLPAARAPGYEPWVYDGRIRVRLRSGRPHV